MAIPSAIVDSLESVVEIYFSGVRGRERAAFILCDNLVEMACKSKAKQHSHLFVMNCGFHAAWNAPGVTLDPVGLGQRVHDHRETRNNMQHASAAATVDAFYCATAILDVAEVIEFLWPASPFPSRIACALRVVRLYASNEHSNTRETFEDKMRKHRWRGESASIKTHELQIELGKRDFWNWALRYRESSIAAILDEIGAA